MAYDSLPCRIASLVHAHFDRLPKRSKPSIRSDGTREWIPMSGVVIVKGESTHSETLTVVSVTTGAKCLSASQIPTCKGLVLHDWHAEILAIRAFNHWLLSECQSILAREQASKGAHPDVNGNNITSPFIRRRQTHNIADNTTPANPNPPFELHPDLKIYMYCTCAPCGDASMELCMAAQEDATPWALDTPSTSTSTPAPGLELARESNNGSTTFKPTLTTNNDQIQPQGQIQDQDQDHLLTGRGYFSRLGIVRRKPARADAAQTKSKSCSDKLSLRQVSSLLSASSSLLVAVTANAYLEGIVMPEDEISAVGCERAFGETGRMGALRGREWGFDTTDGYGAGSVSVSEKDVVDGAGDEVEGQDHTNQPRDQHQHRYRYRYRPFKVLSIPNDLLYSLWPFSKNPPSPSTSPSSTTPPQSTSKAKPGNITAIWITAPSHTTPPPASETGTKSLPHLRGSTTGLYESIINGVKQGTKASAVGAKGASALSRAKQWGLLREVVRMVAASDGDGGGYEGLRRVVEESSTYGVFKRGVGEMTQAGRARNRAIREAKTVLVPWVANRGDEGWGVDVLVDGDGAGGKKRKRDNVPT